MTRYLIREIHHVLVQREVEAESEAAALDDFWSGGGTPSGNDGDVTASALLGVTEIP